MTAGQILRFVYGTNIICLTFCTFGVHEFLEKRGLPLDVFVDRSISETNIAEALSRCHINATILQFVSYISLADSASRFLRHLCLSTNELYSSCAQEVVVLCGSQRIGLVVVVAEEHVRTNHVRPGTAVDFILVRDDRVVTVEL